MIRTNKAKNLIDQVSVTNLIDVLLVLLIIVMISASAVMQTDTNIKLPGAAVRGRMPSSRVEITVTRDGGVLYEGSRIALADLGLKMKEMAAKTPSERRMVLVRADGNADYGKVAQVMDVLRASGIESVSLAVESGGASK